MSTLLLDSAVEETHVSSSICLHKQSLRVTGRLGDTPNVPPIILQNLRSCLQSIFDPEHFPAEREGGKTLPQLCFAIFKETEAQGCWLISAIAWCHRDSLWWYQRSNAPKVLVLTLTWASVSCRWDSRIPTTI